jgi:hypothetical protein
LTNAPTSQALSPPEPSPRLIIINVKGIRGRSIDFSWTWKEKRKNESDEERSAGRSSGCVGEFWAGWVAVMGVLIAGIDRTVGVDIRSEGMDDAVSLRVLYEEYNRIPIVGKSEINVATVANFISSATSNRLDSTNSPSPFQKSQTTFSTW